MSLVFSYFLISILGYSENFQNLFLFKFQDTNDPENGSTIPNECALKIYFETAEQSNDWDELKLVDDQLTAQGQDNSSPEFKIK